METISERLKRLRKAKGLTQAELAKRAGFSSQSGIGNIENGTRGYGASIVAIARELDTTPEYLQLQAELPYEQSPAQPTKIPSAIHDVREDHAPYHHDHSTAKAFQILGRKLAGLDGATKRQAGFILSELVEDPGNHAHLAELLDVALSNNRAGKQHAA